SEAAEVRAAAQGPWLQRRGDRAAPYAARPRDRRHDAGGDRGERGGAVDRGAPRGESGAGMAAAAAAGRSPRGVGGRGGDGGTRRAGAEGSGGPPMMVGVLLAGGASKRMGRPKALVKADAESFLARGVRRLWTACDSVVVVLGSGAREIRGKTEHEF